MPARLPREHRCHCQVQSSVGAQLQLSWDSKRQNSSADLDNFWFCQVYHCDFTTTIFGRPWPSGLRHALSLLTGSFAFRSTWREIPSSYCRGGARQLVHGVLWSRLSGSALWLLSADQSRCWGVRTPWNYLPGLWVPEPAGSFCAEQEPPHATMLG